MKRIYAFTLKKDSDDERFSDDIRLLAYLLYETVYNYREDDKIPLNVNKNIQYNRLNESCGGYSYRFSSDLYEDKDIYYEPFMIGEKTFCFTIVNDLIDEDTIRYLLKNEMRIARLDYEIEITSFEYDSRNIEDEKNREKAIKSIYNKLEIEYVKKGVLIRKLLKPSYKGN